MTLSSNLQHSAVACKRPAGLTQSKPRLERLAACTRTSASQLRDQRRCQLSRYTVSWRSSTAASRSTVEDQHASRPARPLRSATTDIAGTVCSRHSASRAESHRLPLQQRGRTMRPPSLRGSRADGRVDCDLADVDTVDMICGHVDKPATRFVTAASAWLGRCAENGGQASSSSLPYCARRPRLLTGGSSSCSSEALGLCCGRPVSCACDACVSGSRRAAPHGKVIDVILAPSRWPQSPASTSTHAVSAPRR